MKKFEGFSVAGVIAGIAVVILLIVGMKVIIDGNNKIVDYTKYDFNSVIEANKDNGEIGDHVKGDKDAPVLIFEYADFQCSHCARMNRYVNKAVEELDGKLAVVYRSYILPYNQNSTAATSSAEAAGLQGYWKEYADKLFEEQSEWSAASATERTAIFERYFEEVTEGKGDMEKFRQDVASEAVSRKVNFDLGIGKRVDMDGTPAFFVDGQLINRSEASSITIEGKEITWDSGMSGDEFIEVLKKIVEIKLAAK